jgi:hypothetical protein
MSLISGADSGGVSVVQFAQQHVIKINFPYSSSLAFQSHQISGKGFPYKTKASLPFDLSPRCGCKDRTQGGQVSLWDSEVTDCRRSEYGIMIRRRRLV